jgi:uncharacterized membrane protein YpjA
MARSIRTRKDVPLLRVLGRVALVVGGIWVYVMVFNRSVDGDIADLDAYIRKNLRERGLI